MSKPADQRRILFLLPFLAIAAWLAFFADKTPNGEIAEPVARSGAAGQVETGQVTGSASEASAVESSAPAGFARDGVRALLDQDNPVNLFSNGRPPEPERPQTQEPQIPAPDFRFIGRMLRDGRWNVFLDSDKSTYVVTPGSVIKDYRVEAVQSNQVQLTHLPTKSTHIIPIEGGQ
ncbi:hypothetical protein [Viridibacterium curvum]|uniref:Secretion system X translation initiation factor n=1 Tax=Viridibacterium curvum TaxID=1101404 RepID=A0ABP9QDE3_9RHOO